MSREAQSLEQQLEARDPERQHVRDGQASAEGARYEQDWEPPAGFDYGRSRLRRISQAVGLGSGYCHEHIAALNLPAVRGDSRGFDYAGARIERGQSGEEFGKLHRPLRRLQYPPVTNPTATQIVLDAPLSPGLTSQFTAGPWPK